MLGFCQDDNPFKGKNANNELKVKDWNMLLGWHGVMIGWMKNRGEKLARWATNQGEYDATPILCEVD